jgi:hypothetical protein
MAFNQPALVEEQPFRRPRDDGLGDQPVGRPISSPWVVQAKRPAVGRFGIRVDVRRLLAGAPRVEADRRTEHFDGDPRVGDHGAGKMHPREVGDADLVGPGEGPQRPPPNSHEVERTAQPARRKPPADRFVLIRDRQRPHSPVIPEERVACDRPDSWRRHGGDCCRPHDAPGAVLDVRPRRREHVVVHGAPRGALAEQAFQHRTHLVDRQCAAPQQLQGSGEVVHAVPGGRAALRTLVDTLFDAWIETADAQAAGGNTFGYAGQKSPNRLLHMPLAPEIDNLSAAHARFVAGRSMRDVEPGVALNPRDPRGGTIANADDLT